MQKQWKTNTLVSGEIGKGISFGTFGELLQGANADNDLDFLVTLPIEQYSRAEFSPDFSDELKVIPEFRQKSARLAIRLLEYFNLPVGGTLTIESDLPTGKGLASSSADLVATARAIESSYDIEIPVTLIQKFMVEIEPSDGVMYPGVVAYYHRKGELGESFDSLPPLTIVAIDEGGEVDTIKFNESHKEFTKEEKLEYKQLLNQLKTALKKHDISTIGKVATRSAIMNQTRQKKRSLNHFLQLSYQFEALGIVVAHSGTFIGLLLGEDEHHLKLVQLFELLQKKYGQVYVYRTLSQN